MFFNLRHRWFLLTSLLRDEFKCCHQDFVFIFTPAFPQGKFTRSAFLEINIITPHGFQQFPIVLLVPYQDGTKPGLRCNHTTCFVSFDCQYLHSHCLYNQFFWHAVRIYWFTFCQNVWTKEKFKVIIVLIYVATSELDKRSYEKRKCFFLLDQCSVIIVENVTCVIWISYNSIRNFPWVLGEIVFICSHLDSVCKTDPTPQAAKIRF